MIPDRMIEQDTLKTNGVRTSVEVRLPWYRALPASCISEFGLSVDGVAASLESLRWTMNGKTYASDELAGDSSEWWFPTDSVVVEGDIPITAGDEEHTVDVDLSLYIPYIVSDHGVLRIEEHSSKTMKAVSA
ncbi:flagellar biosynthesis protein [Pseudoclavibacter sp. AY1F1]|nr:flagellar biosynthesis protein [Pseudoclavibacter sp. AY1F1]